MLNTILNDFIRDEYPQIKTNIPGEKSKDWSKKLKQFESPHLTYIDDDFPIFWESANSCIIKDVDGNSFIDLNAGFAVSGVGHSNPIIVETIKQQSEKLIHCMGDVHPSSAKIMLGEKLAEITPGDLRQCIFSTSGSDAVDAALKTAIKYTGKSKFISFSGAYHGLTTGALNVTKHNKFRTPFLNQISDNSITLPYPVETTLPYYEPNNFKTLDNYIDFIDWNLSHGGSAWNNIAGIILEPIQGRGGILVPKKGFLKALRDICDRNNIPLILDEIYTGMGRTGKWFACEYESVCPDIMILGKALGGGLPIGACIGTEKIMSAWGDSKGEAEFTHTFTGHPLTMTVGLKVIDIISELMPHINQLSNIFNNEIDDLINEYDILAEKRGLGLMWGIEVVKNENNSIKPDSKLAFDIVKKSLNKGLIMLTGGVFSNVLCFTPPYVISENQIKYSLDLIGAILDEV